MLAEDNTFKSSTPALGNILKDSGTKYLPLVKGTANQALVTNSGATDVGWGTVAVGGGGTGATSLTGVVIGTGTTAMTVKANPTGAFLDDSSAQNVTGAKTFSNQALILRNPAGTFSLTFQNPAITAAYNAAFIDTFDYLVYKDGSNYLAKRHNWAVESSNSDAATVLQYAIDNSGEKGAVGIKGEKGKWYNLSTKLNLIDKNVDLVGINTKRTNASTTENGSSDLGGVVFKKNYATAEPLIDMTNTTYKQATLRNIAIVGNSISGSTGLKAHYVTERTPFLDNINITGFDVGMEASKWVYVDIRGLTVTENLTYGIKFVSTLAKSNTVKFYGGRVNSNPTDLDFGTGTAGNDVKFFGTILEGAASGHTKCVNIASGNNGIGFYGCSFEKNGETTPEIILDNANNNTYFNCRFDCDVNYTPIHIGSTAKNINILTNFFQVNTAAVVGTITIDSGAVDINLIGNTKGTQTVGTISLTDNGTRTTIFNNQSIGLTDSIPTQVKFNDFLDSKIITIPADPATGFIRTYPKAADANTDSLYMKAKLQGTVTEMNFFP